MNGLPNMLLADQKSKNYLSKKKPRLSISSASISTSFYASKRVSKECRQILQGSSKLGSAVAVKNLSLNTNQIGNHTAKWMQDTSKKSPMELINEAPPIKVEGRIFVCEGDNDPALGHPIEFICLDLPEPTICKYCGLRYVQDHHHMDI